MFTVRILLISDTGRNSRCHPTSLKKIKHGRCQRPGDGAAHEPRDCATGIRAPAGNPINSAAKEYKSATNQPWLMTNQYKSAAKEHWFATKGLKSAAKEHWLMANQYKSATKEHWLAGEEIKSVTNQHSFATDQYKSAADGHWLPADVLTKSDDNKRIAHCQINPLPHVINRRPPQTTGSGESGARSGGGRRRTDDRGPRAAGCFNSGQHVSNCV